MPNNYYYDLDKRKHHQRRGHFRRAMLAALLLFLALAIATGVYILQNSKSNASQPVVIKPSTTTYYSGAPKRVYENERFKFEAATNWQLSREESLGTSRFVFFKQTNNIIDYELTISFDNSLNGQSFNYVLPVRLVNGKMRADVLSPRCGDKIVAKQGDSSPNTLTMQFHGATYICAVKGSTEKGVAGLIGGNYQIPLKDPRGHTIPVSFSFVNHTSSYFEGSFKEVLESFTLK